MKSQTETLFKTALNRAQYLLAMREHGAKELKLKLLQKIPALGETPGLVDDVIDYCRQQNWQSDARYIESYVRMALEKGQGALKIRHALLQSTTDAAQVDVELALDELDWIDIARSVLIKKYGDTRQPVDLKEHARRLRFLQSRGFSAAQCYKAFK